MRVSRQRGIGYPFRCRGHPCKRKGIAPQCYFFVRLRSLVRKRPETVCTQKRQRRLALPFRLRRVRDSNPRSPEGLNRFRVCPDRPLWQLSKRQKYEKNHCRKSKICCCISICYTVWQQHMLSEIRNKEDFRTHTLHIRQVFDCVDSHVIMVVVVRKQGCRILSFPNLSFFNFALRPFVVLLPKVFNYGV